jgi:L-Ala-D/L-Glu epimerase
VTTGFAESAQMAASIGFGPDPARPRCAARSALELALLDAAGRHFAVSLSSLVQHVPGLAAIARRSEEARYGAVLSGDEGGVRAWLYRLYGFRDVKVKALGDVARDVALVRSVRRAVGPHVNVRVDANGAWSPKDAADACSRLAAFDVSFIEQPVARENLMEFAGLRPKPSPPILLDESLVSAADAEIAADAKLGDAFNLRISKNGGLMPVLALAKFAIDRRIGLVLGCHPGETGILSAAGRAVACSVKNLMALEGSYDNHVLAANVLDEDITFGRGGRAPRLTGPGLGVTVRTDLLDALTVERIEAM